MQSEYCDIMCAYCVYYFTVYRANAKRDAKRQRELDTALAVPQVSSSAASSNGYLDRSSRPNRGFLPTGTDKTPIGTGAAHKRKKVSHTPPVVTPPVVVVDSLAVAPLVTNEPLVVSHAVTTPSVTAEPLVDSPAVTTPSVTAVPLVDSPAVTPPVNTAVVVADSAVVEAEQVVSLYPPDANEWCERAILVVENFCKQEEGSVVIAKKTIPFGAKFQVFGLVTATESKVKLIGQEQFFYMNSDKLFLFPHRTWVCPFFEMDLVNSVRETAVVFNQMDNSVTAHRDITANTIVKMLCLPFTISPGEHQRRFIEYVRVIEVVEEFKLLLEGVNDVLEVGSGVNSFFKNVFKKVKLELKDQYCDCSTHIASYCQDYPLPTTITAESIVTEDEYARFIMFTIVYAMYESVHIVDGAFKAPAASTPYDLTSMPFPMSLLVFETMRMEFIYPLVAEAKKYEFAGVGARLCEFIRNGVVCLPPGQFDYGDGDGNSSDEITLVHLNKIRRADLGSSHEFTLNVDYKLADVVDFEQLPSDVFALEYVKHIGKFYKSMYDQL